MLQHVCTQIGLNLSLWFKIVYAYLPFKMWFFLNEKVKSEECTLYRLFRLFSWKISPKDSNTSVPYCPYITGFFSVSHLLFFVFDKEFWVQLLEVQQLF